MMRVLLVWVLFFVLAAEGRPHDVSPSVVQPSPATIEESAIHALPSDTSAVVSPDRLATTQSYREDVLTVKRIDEEKWKAITNGVTFREREREVSVPRFSLPWGGPVLKVISYLVIGGVVLLLLYLVLRNMTLDFRIRRTELPLETTDKPVENIEEIDIEVLLAQALAAGNFRAAVRYYYLGLLKKLHALNVIVWKKDKTNRDYLGELFSRSFLYDEIRGLTRAYEAVWYGDHALPPEGFQQIADQFESVYQKIHETKRT